MNETEERKGWFSISVTVAPEVGEAIEYAFNSLESLGTEINHLQKKNADQLMVVGYFNDLPDEERFQDELHYALKTYGFTEEVVLQVERAEIEDADWLAEWKKHWKPSEVGSFLIAPPWSDVDESKIVIRIEPNMAFGTGTHETTQLCLEAIETYYTPGDSFLDVGTGTGILAVAAAKLNLRSQISNFKAVTSDADLKAGASISEATAATGPNLKSQISNFKLLGCDTDVDSIAIAKENAERNGVADNVEFNVGSITHETPVFDFVCANLTLDVIKPLLPLLIEKSGKVLVLSGILAEQETEIRAAFADLNIEDLEIKQAGEWIRVVTRDE